MRNTIHLASLTAVALSVFAFSGCGTKGPNYAEVQKHWASGNTQAASEEIVVKANATKENIDKAEEPLLWELNAGSVTSTNGEFAASESFLAAAQARMAEGSLKEGDEKSLFDRAMAAFGKYEPTMQEAVMVPVLRFYNSMGSGTNAKGLEASINAMTKTQEDMLAQKEKTFFENQKDAASPMAIPMGEEKVSFNPFAEASKSKNAIAAVYEDDSVELEVGKGAIAKAYTNPFAYWLSAVITAHTAQSVDDFKRAGDIVKPALEIDPKNPLLSKTLSKFVQAGNTQNVAAANKKAFGSTSPDMTYVIYEGGQAPAIGSKPVEIQIPKAVNVAVGTVITAAGAMIAKSNGGKYVAANFCANASTVIPTKATAYLPVLESRGETPAFTVNGKVPTTLVDFDPLMNSRLKLEAMDNATLQVVKASGVVVLRGVAILGATTAFVGALENGNPIVINGAARLFKEAVEMSAQPIELSHPDKRVWDFLPRTIGVAELMTPKSGKITLAGEEVAVPAKGVNIVRVYKLNETFPATVQVFTLKNNGTATLVASKRLKASPVVATPVKPVTKKPAKKQTAKKVSKPKSQVKTTPVKKNIRTTPQKKIRTTPVKKSN